MNLVSPAVNVERGLASHKLAHRPVPRADKRALEISLNLLVGISHYRLHRVRRLPQILGLKMIADARCGRGMIEAKVPVHDVDPVHHQVGKNASAKVPKPAPLPK